MANPPEYCCIMFDGDPTEELIIDGDASMDMSEDGEAGVVLKVSDYTEYDGPYEVTPTQETQTLATAGKLVGEDIVVNPIPQNYGLITYNGYSIKVS